jgi:hypothetical protein
MSENGTSAFETPECLEMKGIKIPQSPDQITEEWMTRVLLFKAIIEEPVVVSSLSKTIVVGNSFSAHCVAIRVGCEYSVELNGVETVFLVKIWPSEMLLPEEIARGMFLSDMKGYIEAAPEEWYPRPKLNLCSWNLESDQYVLMTSVRDSIGAEKALLTLDEVQAMVPRLAQVAALWENCHLPNQPMSTQAERLERWTDRANVSMYKGPLGIPYTIGAKLVDKILQTDLGGHWESIEMDGYAELLGGKLFKFFGRVGPKTNASVTLSHGDLRRDNIDFKTKSEWVTSDFHSSCTGPVPTDLAYLMTSGSVLPSVYGDGEAEVTRYFYDEFQRHTNAYRADSYSYEKFMKEYYTMAHVFFVYFVCLGTPVFQSGAVDGKIDPRNPAEVTGPCTWAPELGSGTVVAESLSEEEQAKREWFKNVLANFRDVFSRAGGKTYLDAIGDDATIGSKK